MKTTTFFSLLLAAMAGVCAGSCSKSGKCNITMLSFNNKLSYKVTVHVDGLIGNKYIDPGKSITVDVEPNKTYTYSVSNAYSGQLLIYSTTSVEPCTSSGINIK